MEVTMKITSTTMKDKVSCQKSTNVKEQNIKKSNTKCYNWTTNSLTGKLILKTYHPSLDFLYKLHITYCCSYLGCVLYLAI